MSHGFAQTMKLEFKMSMEGELKFFLCQQMKKINDGIFLSQTKFVRDIVSKFRLQESKPASTSISTSEKITKDLEEAEVDSTYYKSIIESLLYLITSRPNIAFSVGACARYQVTLKESHLKEAKRIIRYVHETKEFGLWYPFDTTSKIVGYSNADWANDVGDRKTTSGGCFYISNSLVS